MGITNFDSVQPSYGTGTESANAVTINAQTGAITTSNLSTGAQGVYTCTLTNNRIGAGSILMTEPMMGSATLGSPILQSATVSAGSCVIKIQNISNAAMNGTLVIPFWILNPTAP